MAFSFSNIQIFCPQESGKVNLENLIEVIRQWAISDNEYEEVKEGEAGEQADLYLSLRTIIIESKAQSPWIGIYDQLIDEDLERTSDFAAFISRAINNPVISNKAQEHYLFEMALYKQGEQIDYYSNDPAGESEGILSDEEIEKRKGHTELWKDFLAEGKTPADLRKAWDNDTYDVREILEELNELFNLPWIGLGLYDVDEIIRDEPDRNFTHLTFKKI